MSNAINLTICLSNPELCEPIIKENAPTLKPVFTPASDFAGNIKKMINELAFDICEMPLGTVVQAISSGMPIVVLPVVMWRRTPHQYLLAQGGSRGTEVGLDWLIGQAVGVRSYAQTTGIWVRTVMQDQFGLTADQMQWVTTSPENFADCPAPLFVKRVSGDSDLIAMAEDARVRAVISTGANPVLSSLAPAIEDPIKSGREWLASHSISPVNHVLVTSEMSFKKWSGAIWDFADSLRAHALSSASAPAWASGDALMGERPNSECFSFSNIAESAAFFVTHCLAQGVINKPVDVSKSMAKGR